MDMEERYFNNIGRDLARIGRRLATNQTLVRLLKYGDKQPLSDDKPDIDGYELIDKNISFVPTVEDDEETTESVVLILLDHFSLNRGNKDFKNLRIRFNVICPTRSWTMDHQSIRPIMIMSEIEKMINGQRIAGIGTMQFSGADRLVISQNISGYVLDYVVDTFN